MSTQIEAAAGTSTALTVVERAQVALRSEKTEADFKAMVETSSSITEITNPDGRTQCHAQLMLYVKARTTLAAVDEEVRADAAAFNKATIAERKRLEAILTPEETRLRTLRDEWDKKLAAEKKVKEEAEARRKAVLQERVEEIRAKAHGVIGKSSAEIAQIIASAESIEIDDSFQEMKAQAEGAKKTTLIQLRCVLEKAEKFEADQKRLEEERAELARRREAQELRNACLAMIRNNFENRILECANIGTLEAYDGVIDGLETYVIDKADYLDVTDQAIATRATTLDLLRTARAALAKRLEDEAAAAAERARLADERRREEKAQRLRNERLESIQGIQRLWLVASRHGTLEGYDAPIAELNRLTLTAEEYGDLLEIATDARDETLKALRERRDALNLRLVEEAAAKAERDRLAEESQRLEAQKAEQEAAARRLEEAEAQRVVTEQAALVASQMPAESQPPEAVATTDTVVVGSGPMVVSEPGSKTYPRWRPKDESIVHLVATTYRATTDVATGWLLDFADRHRKNEAA